MKPELSKVSLGLKILAFVQIIICMGLGSHVIDGGVNHGPLWKCAVASVVFDLAFLLFQLLKIGARLQGNITDQRYFSDLISQIKRYFDNLRTWIEIAILITGAILYFIFGAVFIYYTTGTHRVGQLRINISQLPGASKGHALGSICLITFLTMAIDAIVMFMKKRSAKSARSVIY